MAATLLAACWAASMASVAMALRARGVSQGSPAYYWPHARGNVGKYSMTEHTAPANLTKALSWSWHHPDGQYRTVVTSAPLVDDKKNIYIAAEDGVRKFSHDGKLQWFYGPRGPITTCPSLMDGSLFGNTQEGWVFALDMETGKEVWAEKKAEIAPSDTGYVEAHDGVVVTGLDSGNGGGALRVLGLDARTGQTMWEYKSDVQLWNIMPVFPGDGSWIVMDLHGAVYKHALRDGTLLWKSSLPEASKNSFSDGGVMLGPDGTSYTCSNYQDGQVGTHGALRAYALQDGRLLWDRFLEYPCNSWPVITPDGSSVIVPTGSFVASPAASLEPIRNALHMDVLQVQKLSLSLGPNELKTYGMAEKTAAVRAFDARTGEPQWSTELPPYGRLAARGDEEGFIERSILHKRNQCLPAQFGSPTISGDGTVYVGRADGLLYAVESGTGKYRTFDALAGSLHPGTAWAPGLMAFTTCDGLFVWEY